MSPLQKQLIAVRKEMRILLAYERDLVEELKATCDHPLVELYQWWDEQLSKVTGERCALCGLARPWRGVGSWR